MSEFRIENVPLESLIRDDIQARQKLTGIKELAATIKTQGLHNAIVVWQRPKEDGSVDNVVLAGHRRLAAVDYLIEHGEANGLSEEVPARLIEAETEADARAIALTNNDQSEPLTTFEVANEVARMKELGLNQKEIASKIGRSETWVSTKLKAFMNASPELKKAWKNENLPDEVVEDIAKLEPEKQAEAVAEATEERKEGTTEGKSKAREKVKAKTGKASKMTSKQQQNLVNLIDNSKQKKSPYITGVFDTLRLVGGTIALNKMQPELKDFIKAESDAIAKEQAEAGARAQAKLDGKKGKKKSKAKAAE